MNIILVKLLGSLVDVTAPCEEKNKQTNKKQEKNKQ